MDVGYRWVKEGFICYVREFRFYFIGVGGYFRFFFW